MVNVGIPGRLNYSVASRKIMNRKTALLVVLTLLSASLLVGLTSANAARSQTRGKDSKTVKVLKLDQSHYFFGQTEVYITGDAIKIENQGNLGFKILSKAPKWDIQIYRDDDKTYFTESMATFEETGLVSGLVVGRKSRMLDVKMRKSTYKMDGFEVVRLTTPYKTIKYLPLKDYGPPEIETVMFATYKQTTAGQIPLESVAIGSGRDFITQKTEEGKREVALETKKIEYVNLPESFFTLPTNLKKAKAIADVVSPASTRDKDPALSEFLDAGFGKHRR
jgi:hypothetical protein